MVNRSKQMKLNIRITILILPFILLLSPSMNSKVSSLNFSLFSLLLHLKLSAPPCSFHGVHMSGKVLTQTKLTGKLPNPEITRVDVDVLLYTYSKSLVVLTDKPLASPKLPCFQATNTL